MNNSAFSDNSIVLFAASQDQRRYFESLVANTHLPATVKWYKDMKGVSFSESMPWSALWKQSDILTTRKRNSKKGKHYPSVFWPLFRFMAWLHALFIYAQCIHFLKQESAHFIGVWNGKKFRQAILVEATHNLGCKPIFFETGPMPGYSCIDEKGVNAHSSVPNNANFYRTYPSDALFKVTDALCDAAFRAENDLPEHFIFVPFQVVEDSNIYLHSPWIHTMRQLFEMFERVSEKLVLEGNPRVFVFKPHPACDEDYSDLKARQTKYLQFVDKAETTYLVNCAEAVVTVNSTVGIEGLRAGKKVIVLGDALFNIPELAFPVTSESELSDTLLRLDQKQVDRDLIARFFSYLVHDYAIPGNAMESPGKEHWHFVEAKLKSILTGANRR